VFKIVTIGLKLVFNDLWYSYVIIKLNAAYASGAYNVLISIFK